MSARRTFGLLGAEKQTAVSAALAWPEHHFLFVTDQRVVDGWDLHNVHMRHARPDQTRAMIDGVTWVPLCPRWVAADDAEPRNRFRDFRLSRVLTFLEAMFPDVILPVRPKPELGQVQIIKGDRRHRPDAVVTGVRLPMEEIGDPHACGVLYQEYVPRARLFLATGRRWATGVQLAIFAIHSEACRRDEVLQAGETVEHNRLTQLTLDMLGQLDHRGFFTLNWIEQSGRVWLTSIRPIPRSVLGTVRRAGPDLLEPPRAALELASPGHKFVADIHYSSYQALGA